ncbi:porin family protein [Novosphingobium sp. KCTC 2891]|uniref:outer membrane protein n=1 Tax=Novosphingobium sp. KCTC 2891 TaxID=2989730 RepID=UPI002221811B|nr:porin family protein [Novosphingobium sp. KCTC 2891]MCW1382905.1 porin family protein [Novosphingobium sp. KCTC 2891]
MNKIRAILAVGTALAAAAAAPAFAQDATPAEGFAGPRVEALVGYDHHRSGSSVDNDTTRNTKQSIDGVVFGGGIGYDVATGPNMTIGAEAEITESSAGWDNNNGVPNTFNLGRVDAGRDIYVGGRVGYAMSPSTLLYVKGGYTNARYNLKGTDGTVNLSQRLDTDGWRVGAGVEQKLGQNTFAKLEYRYSNYGKGEFDFNGGTPDSSRFNIDTDRHQVMAGVGVRF